MTVKGPPAFRPLSSFEDYARLTARLDELGRRHAQCQQQIRAAEGRLTAAAQARRDGSRAVALLEGDGPPGGGAAAEAAGEELSRLQREEGDYEKALAEGRARLSSLAGRLSPEALRPVLEWQEAAIGRIARLAEELWPLARAVVDAARAAERAGLDPDALLRARERVRAVLAAVCPPPPYFSR